MKPFLSFRIQCSLMLVMLSVVLLSGCQTTSGDPPEEYLSGLSRDAEAVAVVRLIGPPKYLSTSSAYAELGWSAEVLNTLSGPVQANSKIAVCQHVERSQHEQEAVSGIVFLKRDLRSTPGDRWVIIEGTVIPDSPRNRRLSFAR